MSKFRERFIWSPENGGCLMLQRLIEKNGMLGWANWASQEEGQYPQDDQQTRRAVILMNRRLRAAELHERASRLETKARVLRHRARELENHP